MDQELLVKQAQQLTAALDNTEVAPRAVMFAVSSETGNWKLWIVPKDDAVDKHEFYRLVSERISSIGIDGIDVGSVELFTSKNPAIVGLSKLLHFNGIGNATVSNNTYKGVLLPDGVIIRMAI